MKHNIYQNAKKLLSDTAKSLKKQSSDLPYIRYELNTLTDDLIRQFNHYAMKETISEKQAKQYANWITATCCNLHP